MTAIGDVPPDGKAGRNGRFRLATSRVGLEVLEWVWLHAVTPAGEGRGLKPVPLTLPGGVTAAGLSKASQIRPKLS